MWINHNNKSLHLQMAYGWYNFIMIFYVCCSRLHACMKLWDKEINVGWEGTYRSILTSQAWNGKRSVQFQISNGPCMVQGLVPSKPYELSGKLLSLMFHFLILNPTPPNPPLGHYLLVPFSLYHDTFWHTICWYAGTEWSGPSGHRPA